MPTCLLIIISLLAPLPLHYTSVISTLIQFYLHYLFFFNFNFIINLHYEQPPQADDPYTEPVSFFCPTFQLPMLMPIRASPGLRKSQENIVISWQ